MADRVFLEEQRAVMLKAMTAICGLMLLVGLAGPAGAQSGGPIFGGGEGSEPTEDDGTGSPPDTGLLENEEELGEDSAAVASRITAFSLTEVGTTDVVWTPPAWLASCTVEELTFAELQATRSATAAHYAGVYDADSAFLNDNADWVLLGCVGEGAQVLLGGGVPGSTPAWSGVGYPVGDPSPPRPVVRWVIADALAKVRVPVQAGSSAPSGEDAPMFYQLESVVWVDPGVWQPTSASSSLPGIGVTVTASPVSVRFEALPNDGDDPDGWADCGAAATEPWTPARDEALIAQGCTVTFKQAADAHVLRSELSWGFAWSCEPGCGSGDFDGATITRVNERPVTVLEYLVVEG